ncbi:MAG: site-specific integrase [Acidaminococcaceae bacterium]|nr:site-specific integrase [Acidaminococcaceae bacterium]
MTKEEIFKKLDTEVKLRGLSPGTYKTYKHSINLFLFWVGKPYELLEERDFREYLIYLVNRGNLKRNTINMYNAAVRFLFQVLLEKDINYRRTARLRNTFTLPTVWSIKEVERFLSVITNLRDRAIFLNIYGSGLRVSEICTLTVPDIDSGNMRIRIRQGKGHKDRFTILSHAGLLALREYWKACHPASPGNYLFPGKTANGHLSTGQVENLFRRYLSRANIATPATVHTLRHCFATHALEAGIDILCIKRLLGHSTFETTNVYLHLTNTTVYRTNSPADGLHLQGEY